MKNRAGKFKKHLSGETSYKFFSPSPLPPAPQLKIDAEMLKILVCANRQLAILEGVSKSVPSMEFFASMLAQKEALLSAQLAGTSASLDEILEPNEEHEGAEIREAKACAKAFEFAVKRLETLPLSRQLMLETHAALLQNSEGKTCAVGAFRSTQTWLGKSLWNALYVPPEPAEIDTAMANLDKFFAEDETLDALIQTALIHYQFETIHPFSEGNGRIGRTLITLCLLQKKLLSKPLLCVSRFFKENEAEYHERLAQVRQNGDYEQWVKFFLRAVFDSAKTSLETLERLGDLHRKNEALIHGRASGNLLKLLAHLEANPIIDIKKAADSFGTTFNTAASAVQKFVELGILAPTSSAARNRRFSYPAYLSILREGT